MSAPPVLGDAARLLVTLPGVFSWERPRRQSVKKAGGFWGVRTAYPERYARVRAAWAAVVCAAVVAQEWAPAEGARFLVWVDAHGKGRFDLDRVVTAVADALQGGGAIRDDCLIDGYHARRHPLPAEGEPRTDVEVRIRAKEAHEGRPRRLLRRPGVRTGRGPSARVPPGR